MEHNTKNFRIPVKVKRHELPFSEEVTDEELYQVFRMVCPTLVDCIKTVIGDEIVCPNSNSPRLLFPSNLLTIFLSNAMDFLQSYTSLKIVYIETVLPEFLGENDLLKCVPQYNFDKGKGYVAGIFPKCYLKQKRGFAAVYEAVKGLRDDDPWLLYRAVNMHSEELGLQMATMIKNKFSALSSILSHQARHSRRQVAVPRITPPQRVAALEEGQGDNLLDLNASHQQLQANENAMEE